MDPIEARRAAVPPTAAVRRLRTLTIAALLLFATSGSAVTVTFLSPLQGSQTLGTQTIEVTTDAENLDRVEFSVDGILVGVVREAPYRLLHDFGTDLTSHEITARVFANGYRQTYLASIRTAAVGETIDVDLVEVPLRIRSAHTVHVSDLRLWENTIEQTIRDVHPGRGPAHFAFVVDRSLSMGDGKLAAALHAIDANLALLRPGDSASLILFNHVVSRPRELAREAQARRVLGEVTPSGGTSLRDAVAVAAASANNAEHRTYTIVITDSGDRNSELSEEHALRRISGTKSIISAIVFGSRGRFLEKATENTGGALVSASRQTMGDRLHDLLTDINSRYTLVYQSHGNPRGWRSIRVTPRTRGIGITAARKGYFAG